MTDVNHNPILSVDFNLLINRAGFANNINLNAEFLNNSDVIDFDYDEDDELHCKVSGEIYSKSKYILESDLGAFCSIEKITFLNIMHLNCRSLKNYFLEISQLMNVHGRQISVLAIAETWLNELNKDLFQIEGYNFISKYRESKLNVEGVLVYTLLIMTMLSLMICVLQIRLLSVYLLKVYDLVNPIF